MEGKIEIGTNSKLTIDAILSVAHGRAKVYLPNSCIELLQRRRRSVVDWINSKATPAYGFNRGFGHNVDNAVEPEYLKDLQKNLIRSHSAGVGEPASKPIVRATMLLRAQSLALGHSGVRPEVVNQLVQYINNDICPVVPRFGSVGASGDLAPLSHVALALMGEGEVFVGDSKSPCPTSKALEQFNLEPLTLEMKEGLALNNGVQYSNACGILALEQCRLLLKTAVTATALSHQVFLGGSDAFDPELLNLRPHKGALAVGNWLRNLIEDSPIREAHKDYSVDGEVQDPYNLRCAPQILGAVYDLIEDASITFEIESNSVTDNPIILQDPNCNDEEIRRIVSGGHFHGMPIAIKLYNLMQAISIMARLSNMRSARYIDQARNKGLGSDLIWPGLPDHVKATSSGMMIPEYVSAALTNFIWGASMPSHLFSLSTDAGQEDHVSMSATLACRLIDTLPRLSEILAIELAFGTQAAHIRRHNESIPSKRIPADLSSSKIKSLLAELTSELSESAENNRFEPHVKVSFNYRLNSEERKLSSPCEIAVARISEIFPIVKEDRELSTQLLKLSEAVANGSIIHGLDHYFNR